MQNNEFLQNLIKYVLLGVLWLFVLGILENRRSPKKAARTLKAKAVIIVTWPITVFLTILLELRKLIK
mgnify:CR=1 FL=1